MVLKFTDKEVTAWGEMRLMQEMLSRLNFDGSLKSVGFEEPSSNGAYPVEDLISSFLITIWTGGARFSHAALLRYDEALKKIWRLKQVPSTAPFTRFFNRISELKTDFDTYGFCVGPFWGIETAFKLALLAHNLMALFRQVILQAAKPFPLSTLRFQCFAMGAWVAKKNRKLGLRISLNPPLTRSWFVGLFSNFDTYKKSWNLLPATS